MKDDDTKILEEAYGDMRINGPAAPKNVERIPAGEYPVFFSGFFGRSEYRSIKPVNKTIQVAEQEAEIVNWGIDYPTLGTLYKVEELTDINIKYRKRHGGIDAPGIYLIAIKR